jgi:glycosyltransferase involved in cell wall biosynthesis
MTQLTVLTVLNVAYPFAPVGPNAIGGAEQVLTVLDHTLADAGHHSIVVACERSQTRGELVASVPCHETLSAELCDFGRSAHREKIEQALARWPVDVIHMHGVDFHEYLPETDLPVLVTLHLPLSSYPEQVLRELPCNVHLHCVSESQARACPPGVRLLPIISNGINIAALAARHAKRNFAVALGRICPEKGFHIAVEAANRASVPLILGGEVFGYASHREYWRTELLPKLDRKHRWIGPVDFARKRRLLTSARCLLVPSLVAETGSLVAMEALACGTPVIAFPNGVLADIVEHGTTGFIVRNAEEMSQAIRRANEIDPDTCRRAARERFSLERTTRRYLELYGQLARDHSSSMEERRVA